MGVIPSPLSGISKTDLLIPLDQQLTLSWNDISVAAKTPVTLEDVFFGRPRDTISILKHVGGYVSPGTLTAIMGPSGAGKTTLLNVLAQRNLGGLTTHGQVALNGVPVEKLSVVSKLIGYIQQTDVLPDYLTVKEHLTMMAQLFLDGELDMRVKLLRVDEVITTLGLQKCANVLIGGPNISERISGGERKRLSIAFRLLDNPRVLLIDEPTCGLDSFIASRLVTQLSNLAKCGYTILCVVHQPSSDVFRMFDRLMLLSEGRCAFQGKRQDALKFFSNQGYICPDNYNPADYFTSLLTVKPFMEVECKTLIKESTLKEQAKRDYQASWIVQFILLFWRNIIRLKRLPQRSICKFFAILSNVLLWSTFFFNVDSYLDQGTARNMISLFFFMIVHLTMSSGIPVLATVVDGYNLFKREYKDCLYRPSAFYVACTASELMFSLGSAFCVYSGIYYFTGMYRNTEVFLYSFTFLAYACIISVGYYSLFGMLIGKTDVASSTSFPLQVIFIALGGFFVNLRTLPAYAKPIYYLDWIPWTNEGISILQLGNVPHLDCEFDESICASSGPAYLVQRGFNPDNLMKCTYVLSWQTVFYMIMPYIIMLLKIRRLKD